MKRLFDLFFSLIGLVLLSPFFLILILLIFVIDGRPIFFKQERVGQYGKIFLFYKFRSMKNDTQGILVTKTSDPRITKLGHFLRKSKMDELPQLINVLKGEMSLVGPRPEVPKYTALYSELQKKVLDYPPGITDPASLKFRNESDLIEGTENPEAFYIERIMPDKIKINLSYQRKANVFTDFAIIIKTVVAIFKLK